MNTLKSVAAALALAGLGVAGANGAVLVDESFSYPDGTNLVGQDPAIGGPWAVHSGDGGIDLLVNGGAAVVAQGSTSREDVNVPFEGGYTAGAGDTVYSAFDLTIADPGATPTSTYFAHFLENASTFAARVWVTAPTTSGYRLALSGDSSITDGDGEVFSGDLEFGTTYRVITSYDYDSFQSTLWINPTSPEGGVTTADGGFSDDVFGYALRQAGGNTTQTIDNLLVGQSLLDVGIPEPTGLAALGLGAAGLLRRRRCGSR